MTVQFTDDEPRLLVNMITVEIEATKRVPMSSNTNYMALNTRDLGAVITQPARPAKRAAPP
jgi:hypothetical protein